MDLYKVTYSFLFLSPFALYWHCDRISPFRRRWRRRRRKSPPLSLVARFPVLPRTRYQTAFPNDTGRVALSNSTSRKLRNRSGVFMQCPKRGRVKFLSEGIINSRAAPPRRTQNRNKFHKIGRWTCSLPRRSSIKNQNLRQISLIQPTTQTDDI